MLNKEYDVIMCFSPRVIASGELTENRTNDQWVMKNSLWSISKTGIPVRTPLPAPDISSNTNLP